MQTLFLNYAAPPEVCEHRGGVVVRGFPLAKEVFARLIEVCGGHPQAPAFDLMRILQRGQGKVEVSLPDAPFGIVVAKLPTRDIPTVANYRFDLIGDDLTEGWAAFAALELAEEVLYPAVKLLTVAQPLTTPEENTRVGIDVRHSVLPLLGIVLEGEVSEGTVLTGLAAVQLTETGYKHGKGLKVRLGSTRLRIRLHNLADISHTAEGATVPTLDLEKGRIWVDVYPGSAPALAFELKPAQQLFRYHDLHKAQQLWARIQAGIDSLRVTAL